MNNIKTEITLSNTHDIMKSNTKSIRSVDTDIIDTTIECTNYALRALNICFRCGNPVNINPSYDMYGEIDKDCPHCNYRLW